MKVISSFRKNYTHAYFSEECPFCNPKLIDEQNIKQAEGESWYTCVNKYPILDGNLLLISKRHIIDISDINNNEWRELYEKIEQAKQILLGIMQAKSFNIGINIGEESGSSVQHLHFQIIPRFKQQATKGFQSVIAEIHTVKLSPEELKKRIEEYILEKNDPILAKFA